MVAKCSYHSKRQGQNVSRRKNLTGETIICSWVCICQGLKLHLTSWPHICGQRIYVFMSACACVHVGAIFICGCGRTGVSVSALCRGTKVFGVRKSWWRWTKAPTYLKKEFFFHGDIRLLELPAIYMIIYSVTDDSLLFSLLYLPVFNVVISLLRICHLNDTLLEEHIA